MIIMVSSSCEYRAVAVQENLQLIRALAKYFLITKLNTNDAET